jgi:hypothetical protein
MSFTRLLSCAAGDVSFLSQTYMVELTAICSSFIKHDRRLGQFVTLVIQWSRQDSCRCMVSVIVTARGTQANLKASIIWGHYS